MFANVANIATTMMTASVIVFAYRRIHCLSVRVKAAAFEFVDSC